MSHPINSINKAVDEFMEAFPRLIKDLHDRIDQADNFKLLMDVMTEKDMIKYSMVVKKETLAFYLRHFKKFQKEQKELGDY